MTMHSSPKFCPRLPRQGVVLFLTVTSQLYCALLLQRRSAAAVSVVPGSGIGLASSILYPQKPVLSRPDPVGDAPYTGTSTGRPNNDVDLADIGGDIDLRPPDEAPHPAHQELFEKLPWRRSCFNFLSCGSAAPFAMMQHPDPSSTSVRHQPFMVDDLSLPRQKLTTMAAQPEVEEAGAGGESSSVAAVPPPPPDYRIVLGRGGIGPADSSSDISTSIFHDYLLSDLATLEVRKVGVSFADDAFVQFRKGENSLVRRSPPSDPDRSSVVSDGGASACVWGHNDTGASFVYAVDKVRMGNSWRKSLNTNSYLLERMLGCGGERSTAQNEPPQHSRLETGAVQKSFRLLDLSPLMGPREDQGVRPDLARFKLETTRMVAEKQETKTFDWRKPYLWSCRAPDGTRELGGYPHVDDALEAILVPDPDEQGGGNANGAGKKKRSRRYFCIPPRMIPLRNDWEYMPREEKVPYALTWLIAKRDFTPVPALRKILEFGTRWVDANIGPDEAGQVVERDYYGGPRAHDGKYPIPNEFRSRPKSAAHLSAIAKLVSGDSKNTRYSKCLRELQVGRERALRKLTLAERRRAVEVPITVEAGWEFRDRVGRIKALRELFHIPDACAEVFGEELSAYYKRLHGVAYPIPAVEFNTKDLYIWALGAFAGGGSCRRFAEFATPFLDELALRVLFVLLQEHNEAVTSDEEVLAGYILSNGGDEELSPFYGEDGRNWHRWLSPEPYPMRLPEKELLIIESGGSLSAKQGEGRFVEWN